MRHIEHQLSMLLAAPPGSDAARLRALLSREIELMDELALELERARAKHKPMHSAHEGYAVILEELDELWSEVKMQHQDHRRMQSEALQVAATAIRFIEDLCC